MSVLHLQTSNIISGRRQTIFNTKVRVYTHCFNISWYISFHIHVISATECPLGRLCILSWYEADLVSLLGRNDSPLIA